MTGAAPFNHAGSILSTTHDDRGADAFAKTHTPMPEKHDATGTGSASVALSLPKMALAGARHSWRAAASVVLGVATATAVIVGALLVGDSMRGSLRGLTVERLGEVHTALLPGGFFDPATVLAEPGVGEPLIFFPSGSVEFTPDVDDAATRRAGSVQIVGCDESFWGLGVAGVRPERLPDDDGVVLNASAAEELGVEAGDEVTIRLPVETAVPADSPLGRRDIQTEGLPRMEVLEVVPDEGLGRFAITPNQASPQNVFVARRTLADLLDREGQANALLFREAASRDQLDIDLAALGLNLERIRRVFPPEADDPEVVYDYYSLTSDRLLLSDPVVERVTEALPEDAVVPMLTYLANAIERLDASGNVIASVPYSTITATRSSGPLPLDFSLPGESDASEVAAERTGNTADGGGSGIVPFVLNDWAAERLGAEVGAELRVAYYEPEVENGREIERTFPAVVTQIVPITEPAEPYTRFTDAEFAERPTNYNDPNLTPSVPGVTDQESIGDWDLPFRLEREIERADDEYWNNHRLTPKAFLPLEDGRRLFGSRFGNTTSLRIDTSVGPSADAVAAKVRSAIGPVLDQIGWTLIPVREQQLAASRGTTPFDVLFLLLSFFVILAAVMLIAMLFRLGLVERLKQFGTLLAVGWTPKKVAALTLVEGASIATLGVAVGLAGGWLYAKLVLWALRSWWIGAVKVPFLTFHWTPTSVVIGVAAGWLVSVLAIVWTIRALLKVSVQSLLSGRDTDQPAATAPIEPAGGPASKGGTAEAEPSPQRSRRPRERWRLLSAVAMGIAVLAVGVAAVGASMGGQTAASGFVGAGMMLLIAGLLWIHQRLRRPRAIEGGRDPAAETRYSLGVLSARNASRHPFRSTLSVGLMATAAFLIVAMTAFRLQPTERGTGGFDLLATAAQPLFRDLGDPDVQANLLGPDAEQLEGVEVAAFRMRAGQDASCNNLYQALQPTVLGIPATLAAADDEAAAAGQSGTDADDEEAVGFRWAAAAETDPGSSPWSLLQTRASGTAEDPIPVIIDQNTAMWSLQMRGGVGEVKAFEYEAGKPIHFRVVALLLNSVLQGQLMIGEENFERVFPDISGYRYFLFDTGDRQAADVASVLEDRLGDVGMDVRRADEVLASLLAVQNTYLRTFQSLGALGLLLGTIGLAVAQMRSVLERRQELAVMRAIGFTRQRLAAVVLGETAALLLAGIGCGTLCAVLAVLPYAYISGLRPPIGEPLLVVAGIIAFGMVAGAVAVSRVLRMPLLSSLRAE